MHLANAPVRQATLQELVQYINSFNNYTNYLISVFDKVQRIDTVSPPSTWASLTRAFGERASSMKRAARQIGYRNFRMIFKYKAQGWIHEGTLRGQVQSVVEARGSNSLGSDC